MLLLWLLLLLPGHHAARSTATPTTAPWQRPLSPSPTRSYLSNLVDTTNTTKVYQVTDLGSKTAEWDEQVAESGPTDNAGPTSYVERLLLLLLVLLLLRYCCARHDCTPADVLPLHTATLLPTD